ncbi:MAG: HAD-IIIA family hydrolase [Alphaproteobacteria bacterium]|nr:HAD-IIIA family hydrolase [Alphaproteobacteria bacterium]
MGVRLLALDVDGVLTDGTILYTPEGEQIKAFNVQDGLGIKLLMRAGYEVAVISGRGSAPLEKRLDDLGIHHRRFKCKDKVAALQDICEDIGCGIEDAAFMGDDLIDLRVMSAAAYAIAPPNAVPEVRAIADYITERAGGFGAVREACEHIAALDDVRFVDFFTLDAED